MIPNFSSQSNFLLTWPPTIQKSLIPELEFWKRQFVPECSIPNPNKWYERFLELLIFFFLHLKIRGFTNVTKYAVIGDMYLPTSTIITYKSQPRQHKCLRCQVPWAHVSSVWHPQLCPVQISSGLWASNSPSWGADLSISWRFSFELCPAHLEDKKENIK